MLTGLRKDSDVDPWSTERPRRSTRATVRVLLNWVPEVRAFPVEMIVDRGVNGCEALPVPAFGMADVKSRRDPSPSGQSPASRRCRDPAGKRHKSGACQWRSLRQDQQFHGFPKEFQCCLLVARLRHKAFEDFAFVIDGAPSGVPLAVDLHEHLVEMPSPVA
jgi:hypothetical protein